MNILAAIKREERKLEKQVGELQKQLEGVRDAAKALGRSTNHSVRKLSAQARAQISRAQKRRWAKIRAGMKKAVS
jgi:hypothetical protein